MRGISFEQEATRVYPNEQLLCHILGYVNGDNVGVDGIERTMDEFLRGHDGFRYTERDRTGKEIVPYRGQERDARNGCNVHLTIDMGLQNIVEMELDAAIKQFHPKSATVILMQPKTGEILAMANRPNFDLNAQDDVPPDHRRNRAIADMIEPGSTFKIVTTAAALTEKIVHPGTMINCENGYYAAAKLHDHHPYPDLSVHDILVKSSNIGVAKLAIQLGDQKFYEYVRRFGFGERTGVNLPGEIPGVVHPPHKWSKISITRMPMGQEVGATPLQVTTAMCAIANGGHLMMPQIIRDVVDDQGHTITPFPPQEVRVVASKDATDAIRDALIEVVSPKGTATLAHVAGYKVAGKTGTAQKIDADGHYSHEHYVVSFVGFMPADDPAFVGLVMLDDAEVAHDKNYGGMVAAPHFLAHRRKGRALSWADPFARRTGGQHRRQTDGFPRSMKLDALLSQIETIKVDGPVDREITGLTYDSRRVKPGTVFIALKGEKVDGAAFIETAIAAGAEAIVSDDPALKTRVTNIIVADARHAMADLGAAYFQHPDRALKMAGVTGTNGKTTTAFLIKHMCEAAMFRCGLIGTVRYEVGERVLPAARTTPESLDVHDLLWQMRSAGCKAAVMEVSSHALMQARVRGVEFDAAVFTNLTQDHLDYHKTMEAYFEAKARLFSGLADQKKKKGTGIINLDDRYGAMLVQRFGKDLPLVTYGVGVHADFRASNVRIDFHGTSYQLDAGGRSYLVRLPLIGQFNVYNSLAALAAANAMGIDVRSSVLALATANAVPGRLESVPAQRQFRIFVDYAHTDDALLNVIKTCRELNPARLIVVFGCGGSRDKTKRPRMGSVVDQNADFAIVTSDNPRKEDPLAIIEDIKPGMRRGNYEVIVDRREAIFKAVAMAQPRDIILIAGKGHETYQEFADHTAPFDDRAIARQALAGRHSDT